MSKIGRKSIDTTGLTVTVTGQKVAFKGPKGSGEYIVPEFLKPELKDSQLKLTAQQEVNDLNMYWGLHRSLLANEILGVLKGFEKHIEINGLGFKATTVGKNVELSVGFTHKVTIPLPSNVTVEIDKTGQKLVFRSTSKKAVGDISDAVRAVRPPEPYKGTGIKLAEEVIIRKAGKAKAAA